MSATVLSMPPGRPGRRPIDDDRRVFRLFPTKAGGAYKTGLYAIGFKDGRVKFGKAAHPRRRVLSYWHQTGGAIAWAHYFGRVAESYSRTCQAEIVLCSAAAAVGQRIGRSEYFTGISKAEAIRLGRAARLADLTGPN